MLHLNQWKVKLKAHFDKVADFELAVVVPNYSGWKISLEEAAEAMYPSYTDTHK